LRLLGVLAVVRHLWLCRLGCKPPWPLRLGHLDVSELLTSGGLGSVLGPRCGGQKTGDPVPTSASQSARPVSHPNENRSKRPSVQSISVGHHQNSRRGEIPQEPSGAGNECQDACKNYLYN